VEIEAHRSTFLNFRLFNPFSLVNLARAYSNNNNIKVDIWGDYRTLENNNNNTNIGKI